MFKLVVLCAVAAVASAKPNGLIGGWGSPLIGSSIVGSPLVSAYSGLSSWGASPLVSNIGVAPVVSSYSSPILSGLAGPVVSSIAAPAIIAGAEPALAPGVPAIATKANGKLVDTLDVVVNRNNHLVAKNLAYHGIQKRSVGLVAPLAASWAGPVATPLAASWGSPVVSSWGVSAPALGVSPLVSSYSSSVVSGLAGPVVSSIAAPALIAGVEPALAPGVPAGITKPTGKLVDTLDVVVNRNNHLVAKNLAYHGIQKRSVGLAAPLAASWAGPVATPLAASWAAPVASSWASPLALSSPLISAPVVSPLAARTVIASPVRSVVAPIHAW